MSTSSRVVLGVAIVVLLGVSFWWALSRSTATPTANTNTAPIGWTTYTDPAFGFTFAYPPDWGLVSYPDGTISVAPPRFQEPVPLLKALAGDESAAVSWLNDARGDDGTFIRTADSYALAGRSGPVYQLGGNSYAVILLERFTLIVYMNVLRDSLPFADYFQEYEQILQSLRM